MKTRATPLVWETDLPLFGRTMLMQWNYGMLATALVMLLLLGTVFAAQGEWDALPDLALMVVACTAGLWLLGILIMAVMFRGRFHVRYTLSDDSLLLEVAERKAKIANRAAVIIGVLARKPGLAGSGLIAMSRESEAVNWKGAFTAHPRPERHEIALRNGWRSVMHVQCTPENYGEVLARIEASMQKHKTAKRAEGKSPLPFYLRHTFFILLASAPLFKLADEYHIDLFAPLLVLCFALTTLWLINIFGWVVLGGLVFLAVGTLLDLARVRESTLFPGESWTGFSVFGGDDMSFVLPAILGAAYLAWLSWRALKGGFLALLVRDHSQMDG